MAREPVIWPMSSNIMVVLLDATFLLHELLQADCKHRPSPDSFLSTYRLIIFNSFAFVEYESRRDADDAYHEMHNKRIGRDDLLKIEVRVYQPRSETNIDTSAQWARTPPSATWRYEAGRGREGRDGRDSRDSRDRRDRDRSPARRGGRSPSPRRRDYSPRKDDRRDRGDRDRERDRDRDYDDRRRSRSPADRDRDRDRDMKDDRDRRDDDRDNNANGDDRKGMMDIDTFEDAQWI